MNGSIDVDSRVPARLAGGAGFPDEAPRARLRRSLRSGLLDPERKVTAFLRARGVEVGGDRPWDPVVRDRGLYLDVLLRGTLAVGEGYVAGRWDCEALDVLTARLLRGAPQRRLLASPPALLGEAIGLLANRQAGRRSREVIDTHYDKQAEIIEAIIGPSLCYSCGFWQGAETLEQAQHEKLDLICRKLRLSDRDRVLDIGCGYGAFAVHVARHYGARVVGITLSPRQAAVARQAGAGLPIEIVLGDYQEPSFDGLGKFDRIVSIGMFEHVGRKNYGTFFRKCRDLLAEDGLMLLHTIGRTVHTSIDPWVDRYIFPNGYLPTLSDLDIGREHGLILEDLHNFGADYDRTLMAWYDNLHAAYLRGAVDLDERSYRFWKYYLLSFAGAFRSRCRIQLWQLVLSRDGVPGGYRRPC